MRHYNFNLSWQLQLISPLYLTEFWLNNLTIASLIFYVPQIVHYDNIPYFLQLWLNFTSVYLVKPQLPSISF